MSMLSTTASQENSGSGSNQQTREITFGQAIREALAEEMRRNPKVFIMGEDVAEAGTPFKVLAGLVDEFGPCTGNRLTDLRSRYNWPGCWRCNDWHAPGNRHYVW